MSVIRGNIKKISLGMVLIMALSVGANALEHYDNSFTDVSPEDWYYAYVRKAFTANIMNGKSETIFAPNENITRAMVAAMFYRLEGSPAVNTESAFSDIERDAWYAKAVDWANEMGVITGYSEKTFAPDDFITREQFMTMIYRFEQVSGNDFEKNWVHRFTYNDKGTLSDWATDGAAWCTLNGIFVGKGNNDLDPLGNTTRAEAAKVMVILYENAQK